MSVISTDASHTTLISAESRIDIQSSELDLRGLDTLFPQEKLSDETLDWLTKAKEKLSHESPKEQCPKSTDMRLGKCTYCYLIYRHISKVQCIQHDSQSQVSRTHRL